tara:strand:+ start:3263 stop:3634 length:372 start_codon:yes stop_codon:yes gene_type:complete
MEIPNSVSMTELNQLFDKAPNENVEFTDSESFTSEQYLDIFNKHRNNLLEDINTPFALKGMAVICIHCLAQYHNSVSSKAFETNDPTCLIWSKDAGRLHDAHAILTTICTGTDDFMLLEPKEE